MEQVKDFPGSSLESQVFSPRKGQWQPSTMPTLSKCRREKRVQGQKLEEKVKVSFQELVLGAGKPEECNKEAQNKYNGTARVSKLQSTQGDQRRRGQRQRGSHHTLTDLVQREGGAQRR